MANVLVGIRALQRSVIEILRRADKGGEGSIVQGFRERIVGVEPEVLPHLLAGRERQAMVNAAPAVVHVIEQPDRNEHALEKTLPGGEIRWGWSVVAKCI